MKEESEVQRYQHKGTLANMLLWRYKIVSYE